MAHCFHYSILVPLLVILMSDIRRQRAQDILNQFNVYLSFDRMVEILIQFAQDECEREQSTRIDWIRCVDQLPPMETPVLVWVKDRFDIGELRWEKPGFEDTFAAYKYWDCPHNDGQEWEWDDVTEWKHISPPKNKTMATL